MRRILANNNALVKLLFNNKLTELVKGFGSEYFLVKSIYFDKPPQANWFVGWHQDTTISVKQKILTDGFSNWTEKEDAFSVQPPVYLLQNIITVRIHLDDTSRFNGALHIIPQSHNRGVVRIENQNVAHATVCEVSAGGILVFKPLLFHSSKRTTNNKSRRVIHLEFSNQPLPNGLEWAEKMTV